MEAPSRFAIALAFLPWPPKRALRPWMQCSAGATPRQRSPRGRPPSAAEDFCLFTARHGRTLPRSGSPRRSTRCATARIGKSGASQRIPARARRTQGPAGPAHPGCLGAGPRLVTATSELANLDDHHPDFDLRHDGVMGRLITVAPVYYGLSERDLELARQITAIARKLDVPADPSIVQTVQVTIDAFDIPKVKPFWRAVLGYQDRDDSPEDLVDPP